MVRQTHSSNARMKKKRMKKMKNNSNARKNPPIENSCLTLEHSVNGL